MKHVHDHKAALVLSGGGARAAYEVGVLKAVRQLMPERRRSPFSIFCGVSAGALNATSLALAADDFWSGIDDLETFWAGLHAGAVYRADPWGIAVSGGRWLGALSIGWLLGMAPRGLLDNSPLAGLLEKQLDFDGLEKVIASQSLRALSITCSGYASGQCVSFFQGRADLEPWQRVQRVGAHIALNVKHVLASMAVPFMFSAVKLHREYFGDGAMRELAPLSPAVRLGAERILVIGTGRMAAEDGARSASKSYPSLAETGGHVLSGIYVDSLTADIERMEQVNRLSAKIPEEERQRDGLPWRPIDLMVIQPSERLDVVAAGMAEDLPWAVRGLLRGVGVRDNAGGAFASYLLFESRYIRHLIDIGYRDAMARSGELTHFLNLDIT